MSNRRSPEPLSLGLLAIQQAHNARTPEAAILGALRFLVSRLGIAQPPVALRPVLNALNVDFKWTDAYRKRGRANADLSDESGRLVIHLRKTGLTTNFRRERYLIAHELVHALILKLLPTGDLIASLDATTADYERLERLCDLGAREILMPETMLHASLNKVELSPKGLLSLYDSYLVPKWLLLQRIAEVQPSTGFLVWKRMSRGPHEAVEWRVSDSWPLYDPEYIRPWLPKGSTTKHIGGDLLTDSAGAAMPMTHKQVKLWVGAHSWLCDITLTSLAEREKGTVPNLDGLDVPDEPGVTEPTILMYATAQGRASKTTRTRSTGNEKEDLHLRSNLFGSQLRAGS